MLAQQHSCEGAWQMLHQTNDHTVLQGMHYHVQKQLLLNSDPDSTK